jgi:hypothetical protein
VSAIRRQASLASTRSQTTYVTVEGGADPLAEDAAAAERDRAAVGVLQQRPDQPRPRGAGRPPRRGARRPSWIGRPELALHQLVDLDRLQAGLAGGGERGALPRPMKPMKTSAGLIGLTREVDALLVGGDGG